MCFGFQLKTETTYCVSSTNDEMKPVLYATLTFGRNAGTHEANQFREYEAWMSKLARTTRTCIDAVGGWDIQHSHIHLEVRCPYSQRAKFLHRFKRFDADQAWSHKHYKLEEWDEAKQDKGRDYIRVKHSPTMLSACAGVRKPCRAGRCSCRNHND